MLRVTAEENSSARKLPHLDAPKTAGGITRAKDLIEARVERRGGVRLRTPTRSKEERGRHGHAPKRNHENGEQPCKVPSNPNMRSAGTTVNSRRSTVEGESRQKEVHSCQLTVNSEGLQKEFRCGLRSPLPNNPDDVVRQRTSEAGLRGGMLAVGRNLRGNPRRRSMADLRERLLGHNDPGDDVAKHATAAEEHQHDPQNPNQCGV